MVLTLGNSNSKYVKPLPTIGRRYKRTEIEEKLAFLYKVMDKDSALYQGGDDMSDIVSKELMILYKMCLKYDQTEFPRSFEHGMYSYATRVFKVYTTVGRGDIKKIEHIYVDSMYWPLQGAFLSRQIMNQFFEKSYCWKDPSAKKAPLNVEEAYSLGLPKNLNYAQVVRISNGMGFALRNDVWENQFIRSTNCFSFIDLRIHDR